MRTPGDHVAGEEGLTSARWQVLGAIALANGPLTVPQIARRMGLTRQTVHTTVNRLLAARLVELTPNADHHRSQLVCLTELGQVRFEAIDRKQAVWINQLTRGLRSSDLDATACMLNELCTKLEADLSRAQSEKGEAR